MSALFCVVEAEIFQRFATGHELAKTFGFYRLGEAG